MKHLFLSGEGNPKWGGGIMHLSGYIYILRPDHPSAGRHHGYVAEHRIVMEEHIGRHLLSNEVVHHINGKKDDNRIENLQLIKNHSTHQHEHMIGNIRASGRRGKTFVDHTNTRCYRCHGKNPGYRWVHEIDSNGQRIGYLCHSCYNKQWYRDSKTG